jgi:hypothetical protein
MLLLLACGGFASTIQATFSYNFTGLTICSATATTNCATSFEAGTLSAAGVFTSLGTIPFPAAPTGTVTGITGTFTVSGVFGLQQFALVILAKDLNGNPITSNPTSAAGSLSVLPAAPTGASFSQTQ